MENQEFYQTGYYNTQFTPEKHLSEAKNVENFIIDDLLDFPNDDSMVMTDGGGAFEETVITGASSITAADTSCNSASTGEQYFNHAAGGLQTFTDGFSSELCVPYDDLAELEWLSSVVDESISCEDLDLQKMQLYQGMKARNTNEGSRPPQFQFQPENTQNGPTFHREMSVPAKARSKRSRTAPGNWTSRLLAVSPSPAGNVIPAMSSSSESDITVAIKNKSGKQIMPRKKDGAEEYNEGRKCLHCATDKTPQWRTGPMGPKTLCNACGVRYKSGRLVPEYRPAASPTFVLTKHSNSHRKVLELRRQKDMGRAQHHQHQHHQQHFLHQQHQNMMYDHVSNGDEYLIHQHIGPDYRQLI